MAPRLVVGRDARVLQETDDGMDLVSRLRLRPGYLVDVVLDRPGVAGTRRLALVWTWRLLAAGSDGPFFRGTCRWHRPRGKELPDPDHATDRIPNQPGPGRWHRS
jgi:hypothetical protein